MMDFFNKTIQNVYNSFSTKEKRPNINFIKITELNMGIDNITNISIILYINERINIYLLQTDPIIEFTNILISLALVVGFILIAILVPSFLPLESASL